MLIAKSCHDLDIISWLMDRRCLTVASYGELTHFRPENAPQGAIILADVIARATEQVLAAVKVLEKGKTPVVIQACIEVKKLEEEGDAVYTEWLGRLFDDEKDPIALIKWKEIYDTLESTLDQAEDVANILESIAIKHS